MRSPVLTYRAAAGGVGAYLQASAAHHLNDETKERQIRQRLHRHDGGTGAPPARRVIALCTGLYAPRNGIAATVAVLCAASISGAIFLIVEMYSPFDGCLRVSDAPFRAALGYLKQ